MSFFSKISSERSSSRSDGRNNISTDNPLGSTLENMAVPHKSLFPELSLNTRIKFFMVFLLVSIFLAILAIAMIPLSLKTFAALYTISTVCCLFSVLFLVGPLEQLKSMCQLTRLSATILLILFIILTIVSSLAWKSAPLAIMFCVCQFGCFIWYVLSYVPYSRTVIKHFGSAACSCV